MSTTKYFYQKLTGCLVTEKKDNPFGDSAEVITPIAKFNIRRFSSAYSSTEEMPKKFNFNEKEKINHFSEIIERVLFNLKQDYDRNNFISEDNTLLYNSFLEEVSSFFKKKDAIYFSLKSISAAKDKTEAEKSYKEWFAENQEQIVDFLNCIAKIYEALTITAKIKDALFELADSIIFVLATVGLTLILLKAAPLVISWAIVSESIKLASLSTVSGISLLATGWNKIFNQESAQIAKAIKKEAHKSFAPNA